MALLFADGMDMYTTSADIASKWDSSYLNVFNGTTGRFGSGAITLHSNYPGYPSKVISYTVSNTVPINYGFWYKDSLSSTNVGAGAFNSTFITTGGNWSMLAVVAGSNVLKLNNDLNGAHGQTIGSHTVGGSGWHWIEVSTLFHTSAGYVKVYVDGILDISYSGATCASVPATILNILPGQCSQWFNNGNIYLDDFIVWDGSGTAVNNFPLGPQRISTFVPTANGDLSGFTPSAGTNYTCVNSGFAGTNSVSDTSTGVTDLYAFGTISYNPLNINAVVANYYGQNAGVGTAFLHPTIKTGTTVLTTGTIQLTNGTNRNYQAVFESDANGTGWTTSTINTIQVGITD